MFEPIRGGTRGGQAEFKWTDVVADKDRENYLGHSVNAPAGRWQKNKDIHWYARDQLGDEDARAEIARVKAAEAEAMSVALGFEPTKGEPGAAVSGANAVPVVPAAGAPAGAGDATLDPDGAVRAAEKEERRGLKAERRAAKEAKRAAKEERRAARGERRPGREHEDGRRRSRSLSPTPPRSERSRSSRPRHDERAPLRRRSRSPDRRRDAHRADSRDRGDRRWDPAPRWTDREDGRQDRRR